MTLKQWESNGWLKAEPNSRDEIANLLAIVDRDLKDATSSVSADWQFGIAYNAALKLCMILLRSEGYRPSQGLQHYRTIAAMPLILGTSRKDDALYLDACRKKRNTVEYDYVGGASEDDARELLEFARGFKKDVLEWLEQNHRELT
ncbi:MAG: hypothetical protein ABIK89_09865 [Planctomycetota bacterium]